MTTTTHTAMGVAIGMHIGNPVLGFVIGMISHLLLDMIPHGDAFIADKFYSEDKKKMPIIYSTVDSLIAITFLIILFTLQPHPATLTITATVTGSVLPDALVGIYALTKTKYLAKLNEMHSFFHDFFLKRYKDVKLQYSLAAQIGLITLLFQFA